MRKALIVIIILLCANPALAANHYVCDGGSGNGSNWTLCAALPGATDWIGGDTYYVATGSGYGALRIEGLASGSGTVTINKATAANAGGVAGWQAAFGTGQAIFTTTSVIGHTVEISNVVIDGQYRETEKTGHGFKLINDHTTLDTNGITVKSGSSTITIKYIEIAMNESASGINNALKLNATNYGDISSITVQYSYLHGATQDIILLRNINTMTIDNCYLARNIVTGGTHGQGISNDCSNSVTVSNSTFEDIISSGQITTGMNSTCASDGWKIYNNIFFATTTGLSAGGIRNWDGYGTRTGWYIVGNVFYLIDNGCSACQPAIEFPTGSSGNYVYNNIFYSPGNGTTLSILNVTNNYNAYYGNSGRPAEANRVDLTGSPFVSTSNFHLVAGAEVIGQGKNDLGSPYSTDKDGVARGAAWDIGAYEYITYPSMPLGSGATMSIGTGATMTVH